MYTSLILSVLVAGAGALQNLGPHNSATLKPQSVTGFKCLDSDANGCADDPTWCYGDCSPNDCAYFGQKVKPD